jgi:hypothetical protein
MSAISSKELFHVLEEVLQDAVAHAADCIIVTAGCAWFRFNADTGTLVASIPHGRTVWPAVRDLFLRLRADAEAHGFSKCVVVNDGTKGITVLLSGNERYFHRKVGGIMNRLRRTDAACNSNAEQA